MRSLSNSLTGPALLCVRVDFRDNFNDILLTLL